MNLERSPLVDFGIANGEKPLVLFEISSYHSLNMPKNLSSDLKSP